MKVRSNLLRLKAGTSFTISEKSEAYNKSYTAVQRAVARLIASGHVTGALSQKFTGKRGRPAWIYQRTEAV